MSTIRIGNFAPVGGGQSTPLRAYPKMDFYYAQTGPTVTASINLSSITDNSTGVFTCNFSSTMADVNWVAAGAVQNSATARVFTNHTRATTSGAFVIRDTGGTTQDDVSSGFFSGDVA